MYVTRLFLSDTAFLPRFRHCRWLLLFFILGSLFAGSKADAQPAAAELGDVEITLRRGPCQCCCPIYTVNVHGDGRVVFTAGSIGVLLPGTHEDRIAPEAVAALLERFLKAGFFKLRSSYLAPESSDLPRYVLTVDTGQRHKSVADQMGAGAGMPKVVTELERAVDEAAGTARWLRGRAGLMAWLEGQNFDFQSPDAARLALEGANGSADEAMILALIGHGAPLDSDVSIVPPETMRKAKAIFPEYTPVLPGDALMASAIRRGLAKLFTELAAAGWLDHLGKERAAQLFAFSAGGCSPALVDAVADAGVDIDTPAPATPVEPEYRGSFSPAYGKTALAQLAQGGPAAPYVWRDRVADRLATVQRLLARGADPNHRDKSGHTPLFGVENPDMVNLLLAHGAERR
jgi:hypothetical protein